MNFKGVIASLMYLKLTRKAPFKARLMGFYILHAVVNLNGQGPSYDELYGVMFPVLVNVAYIS